MPLFHFNVYDGNDFIDEEGAELADVAAARTEAVRLAGDLLREHAAKFWDGEQWRMDVTDAAGLIQFSLMFVAIDGPSQRADGPIA